MTESELEKLFGKGSGDPDMQEYYPGEAPKAPTKINTGSGLINR